MTVAIETSSGTSRTIHSIAAAWILSVAFDLFLHGGLLARLYLEPGGFLLPARDSFRRIPLGYLAFLILTIAIAWLIRRLDVRGAARGLRLGLAAGAITWGALAIGLYSITTATIPLLAGWWIGQAIELGLAGAVLGASAGGASIKRIWVTVAVAASVLVVATIALQSLGFAPASVTVSRP